ncbi:hypothetical protein COOONC_22161 [Cooperia oncophora]
MVLLNPQKIDEQYRPRWKSIPRCKDGQQWALSPRSAAYCEDITLITKLRNCITRSKPSLSPYGRQSKYQNAEKMYKQNFIDPCNPSAELTSEGPSSIKLKGRRLDYDCKKRQAQREVSVISFPFSVRKGASTSLIAESAEGRSLLGSISASV